MCPPRIPAARRFFSAALMACMVAGLAACNRENGEERSAGPADLPAPVEAVAEETGPSPHVATGPGKVMVAKKPDQKWSPMETRLLEDLPEIPADRHASRFGGMMPDGGPLPATGFFHTVKKNGRWWLVDPEGNLFIHRGVTTVRGNRAANGRKARLERFGSEENWAAETGRLLRDHGFNGTGSWSDDARLQASGGGLVYTRNWNFMSSYGRQRGGTYQRPGNTGYPGGVPFIFDPEFKDFCEEHAKQLAATKDDPWLLGHFTDNELPWNRNMLENYLALPEGDPGRKAAEEWRRAGNRKPGASITDREKREFLEYAVDTYFSIVAAAIRRHAPNQLVLGSRFHGSALRFPEVFRAAGRHLDVVSVNYYHAWTPDAERMDMWAKESGKPFIITEWYAKGEDSGMPNHGGAGWLVRTQRERGMFYQNFTLALMESRNCVGWHWFRYQDNDPEDRQADPSNRDSNKGIVSNRYKEYTDLLDAMREINVRTHGLIRHFDGAETSP